MEPPQVQSSAKPEGTPVLSQHASACVLISCTQVTETPPWHPMSRASNNVAKPQKASTAFSIRYSSSCATLSSASLSPCTYQVHAYNVQQVVDQRKHYHRATFAYKAPTSRKYVDLKRLFLSLLLQEAVHGLHNVIQIQTGTINGTIVEEIGTMKWVPLTRPRRARMRKTTFRSGYSMFVDNDAAGRYCVFHFFVARAGGHAR